MKKNSISLILLFVLASRIPAQWDSYLIPSSTTIFDSIDALGNNFAVTSSGNKIFITANSGKTWTSKNLPSGVTGVTDISIVNTTIFYISTTGGSFYKTADGGDTWITIFSNPNLCSFGNYIEMFSETRGIAMGDAPGGGTWPVILRTINGTNWTQMCGQSVGWSGDTWRRLDFVDENVGYFFEAGNNPQKLMKTTNGGAFWTALNLPSPLVQVIKFYDADFGLVYENGTFYKTTDGGNSWVISATINPPGWGMDIEFLPGDKNKVWFTNMGGLYYSSDGGSTWSTQAYSATSSLHFSDIVFTSKNVGWILKRTGGVYYTNSNGGLAASASSEIVLPSTFKLSQNFPNPFNPATVISYQLPRGIHVALKIYDLLGREVAVIVDEFKNAGVHNSTFPAQNFLLPSGIYFYRLSAGEFSLSRKMILLK